jgi:AcrR family transcriptional regulator
MSARLVTAPRKPRVDSQRNRERLLRAATRVFSAGGRDATLEAVAKKAGVGIGTLYRHFPTREALFEAVYRREVDELGELAERLAGEAAPVDALRQWLNAFVQLVATKKGMLAALSLAALGPSAQLYAYSFERLSKAIGAVLQRAITAGEIRADITPEDLLRAVLGLCHSNDGPQWLKTVTRLIEVFVDGLMLKR